MLDINPEETNDYLRANAEQLGVLTTHIEDIIDSNPSKYIVNLRSNVENITSAEGLLTVEAVQKHHPDLTLPQVVEEVVGENDAVFFLAKLFVNSTKMAYKKGVDMLYPDLYPQESVRQDVSFDSATYKAIDLRDYRDKRYYDFYATELTGIGILRNIRLFSFKQTENGVQEDITIFSAEEKPVGINYSLEAADDNYWDYAGELKDDKDVMDNAREIRNSYYSKDYLTIKIYEVMEKYLDDPREKEIESYLKLVAEHNISRRENLKMQLLLGPNLPSTEKIEEITSIIS